MSRSYETSMAYTYGTLPGETALYVYRITRVNEDGDVVELSWPQVKARCAQLGVDHVPELDMFFADQRDGMGVTPETVKATVESLAEGESTIDGRHIREGVVIRIDKPNGTTTWLKEKSFTFGVLEGYLKEQDDYVDAEEIA